MIDIDKNIVISLLSNVKERPDGNLRCKCPWCGKDEFYINVNLDHFPFQCWRKNACGIEGNIFSLLKKLERTDLIKKENLDLTQLLQLIDDERKQEKIPKKYVKDQELPIGFKRLNYNEYLHARGFTDYQKYIVGTTSLIGSLKDYIIIAIEQDKRIKGFIGRYYGQDPDILKNKKYNNSKSDFDSLLFGIDDVNQNTNTVILVEGIFDKFNIDKHLCLNSFDEIKCLSTFGCKISQYQINLLLKKDIKKVILFYDNDVSDKIKKYAIEIKKYINNVEIVFLRQQNKDAGDLSVDELIDALNNTLSIDQFIVSSVKIKKLF